MGFWSSIGSAISGISTHDNSKEPTITFTDYDNKLKAIQRFELEPTTSTSHLVIDQTCVNGTAECLPKPRTSK